MESQDTGDLCSGFIPTCGLFYSLEPVIPPLWVSSFLFLPHQGPPRVLLALTGGPAVVLFFFLGSPELSGGRSGRNHLSERSYHQQLQSSKYGYYLGVTQNPLLLSSCGGSLLPPPQPSAVSGADSIPDSMGRKVTRQGNACIPFPELSRVAT